MLFITVMVDAPAGKSDLGTEGERVCLLLLRRGADGGAENLRGVLPKEMWVFGD